MPNEQLTPPMFEPNTDSFTDREKLNRRAKAIVAARNLFATDIAKLDDAAVSGLYRATVKSVFNIEDDDGKVAFGKKAGDARTNIDLLRRFFKGEYSLIQDEEYKKWNEMDEMQKFKYALEQETIRNKATSYIKGERGASLGENVVAGLQYSGVGLPTGAMASARQTTGNDKLESDAQDILMEGARRSNYDTLTPEEQAAYRQDVIDDYDKKLSKRQALATYLAVKDGLSDRGAMLLAKAFNTGKVDVNEMEALWPKDRDRVYTALSIMRGDKQKGRILGISTDFTDDTKFNRFQLGLYGLQQSIVSLVTDTGSFLKDIGKTIYGKYILSAAKRKQFFDKWDAEARAEQALQQGLPDAESGFGEGFQALMENLHWFIPSGLALKGGKLMRASAGVAEDAKWYKKLAFSLNPLRYGKAEKNIVEFSENALRLAKAEKAATLDRLLILDKISGAGKWTEGNVFLARQAAAIEQYTKALQDAQKAVKAAKLSGNAGLSMYLAGKASYFSAFAEEYVTNCDAAGISREDSVPMAAIIGWLNATIEDIYVPGLEKGLSRSEVKSLMFTSLLNAIKTDGMVGARKWLGNRVIYGLTQGVKVALEEGAIEEPLQQIVIEHGKALAETSQKLRENGQGDLADQLMAYWDAMKDTAANDLNTYLDTAIDMLPSSIAFGLTTIGNQTRRQSINDAVQRFKNRRSGNAPKSMFSPNAEGTIQFNPNALDYDSGVADIVAKAVQAQNAIKAHWDGVAASGESGKFAADPNGLTKALSAARTAWERGEGDIIESIANAAAVDTKTAEVLFDYFAAEAQAEIGSPNIKNFIAHDLSTVDFSEETLKKVLPGYVEGSFVHDEKQGLYAGEIKLPNGETKTIAYVYGDISDKLSAMVEKESRLDSRLGQSHDARIESGTESGKLWKDMDEAERYRYAIRSVNGISTGSGAFVVTNDKGEEIVINADDVIYLSNGEFGRIGYGPMATMGTVRHETWHAIWRFISPELSVDEKKNLAKILGVDVASDKWETKLDEAMAYQFQQYATGNYVSHAVDGAIARFVNSASGKMIKQLAKLGIAEEIKNPKTGKAYTLSDFYDAVLRGEIGTGRLGYVQAEAPVPPQADTHKQSTKELPIEVSTEEVKTVESQVAKAAEEASVIPSNTPKPEYSIDNPADASVPDARFYRVSAGDGVTIVGELVVSDASQLKTSYKGNLSDPKLQNRGETKEGAALVKKIAGSPNALEVGTVQPRANNGFVWTTPSLDVFIGNTRSTGIDEAYNRGNGQAIEAHMRSEAEKRGIEIPESIKHPVVHFVLRKIESDGAKADIYEVVRMTNESINRGMNDYEQAKNDADVLIKNKLTSGIVLNAEGNIDTAKSADAIGAFRQLTGAQGLIDENTDNLSAKGQERIKNAVLASLLKDANPTLLEKLINQSKYLDIENEKSSIMRALTELSRLAAEKPQYDLLAPIAEALEYYTEWRERNEKERVEEGKDRRNWRGIAWEDHMAQADFFRTPSPEARIIGDLLAASRKLRSFDKEDNESAAGKVRAQKMISDYLASYVASADAINTETDDLFNRTPPSKLELLNHLRSNDNSPRFSTIKVDDSNYLEALKRPDANERTTLLAPNGAK